MKNAILFMYLIALAPYAFGQNEPGSENKNFKYSNFIDLNTSFSTGQFAGSLAAYHLHGFGKKKQKFKIGYGLRFTSYVGANKIYSTAPSRYTSAVQGPGTIFSETINENIDSIAFRTSQVNLLNLAIYLQYSISKFDIGFNIDAVGFSFGSKKEINIISSTFDNGQSPVQEAKPTSLNLLLTSDNDIGSLNSEFYLRYWISRKIGVKAGFTFLFTEYRTLKDLSFDSGRIVNDRYRLKSSMALLGISYRPFNK